MDDFDGAVALKQLAHDVRNALNGVAVNLEVARVRVARGADAAQVAPFLETAAQQLDAAARLHKRYTDAASGVAGVAAPTRAARAADEQTEAANTSETPPTHGN